MIPGVKGRVIEVPVRPSTALKQGDVLFRIDPEPFRLTIDGLKACLGSAEKDLERSAVLVDERQAQLRDAEYDLEQTVVRAPGDGYVTQVTLRPGMLALPVNLNPAMTYVHSDGRYVIGWFRQNSILRLAPGNEAELALDAAPGRIFRGKVAAVLPAIAEGQLPVGVFGQMALYTDHFTMSR